MLEGRSGLSQATLRKNPYRMIPPVVSDKSIIDHFKSVSRLTRSFLVADYKRKAKGGLSGRSLLLLLLASNFSTATSRSLADKHHEGQRQVA